jgi:hypothetical protein
VCLHATAVSPRLPCHYPCHQSPVISNLLPIAGTKFRNTNCNRGWFCRRTVSIYHTRRANQLCSENIQISPRLLSSTQSNMKPVSTRLRAQRRLKYYLIAIVAVLLIFTYFTVSLSHANESTVIRCVAFSNSTPRLLRPMPQGESKNGPFTSPL